MYFAEFYIVYPGQSKFPSSLDFPWKIFSLDTHFRASRFHFSAILPVEIFKNFSWSLLQWSENKFRPAGIWTRFTDFIFPCYYYSSQHLVRIRRMHTSKNVSCYDCAYLLVRHYYESMIVCRPCACAFAVYVNGLRSYAQAYKWVHLRACVSLLARVSYSRLCRSLHFVFRKNCNWIIYEYVLIYLTQIQLTHTHTHTHTHIYIYIYIYE